MNSTASGERLVEYLNTWGTAVEVASDRIERAGRAVLPTATTRSNPSPTPENREDPERVAVQEMARQHPEGFGHWVVTDAAGNVLEELGVGPLRRLRFGLRQMPRRR